MIQLSRRICYLYSYPSNLSKLKTAQGSVLAEMAIAISVPLIGIQSDSVKSYFLRVSQFPISQQ